MSQDKDILVSGLLPIRVGLAYVTVGATVMVVAFLVQDTLYDVLHYTRVVADLGLALFLMAGVVFAAWGIVVLWPSREQVRMLKK